MGPEQRRGHRRTDEDRRKDIRFDSFLEETAFIRLEAQTGDQAAGLISFHRRY